MSNIHYLSDLPSNHDAEFGETHSILRSQQEVASKRIIDLIFPSFAWNRFILWCSVVQLVVFIVSLCLGSSRLQPNSQVLLNLGGSYGRLIQRGELWRLFTPLLLHSSLWHFLINVFFQLHLGFAIEKTYGLYFMTLMYLLHGMVGNSFSSAINPCQMAVGCSTAGFGLFGVSMTDILLTWKTLHNKNEVIINIILFFFISLFLSTMPGTTIDWAGHVGGLISGIAFSLVFSKIKTDIHWLHRVRRPLGLSLLIFIPAVSLTVLLFSSLDGPNGRCV